MESRQPFVKLSHIEKSFPGVQALTDINLSILPGKVHVLLGENGAGKSTIIKVISGVYQADSGTLTVAGQVETFMTTKESLAKGISIIHQELSVIHDLTVAENIFLGREPKNKWGFIDKDRMIEQTKQLLEGIGVAINPQAYIRQLNNGDRQMVEIARAVSQNSRLVIMDEPTSSLSDKEVRGLFRVIQQLKATGVAIIYISHRLPEIREIGDTISILRDGHLVKTTTVSEINNDEMITLMVGRQMMQFYYKAESAVETSVVLEVENLTRKGAFTNVSFQLRKGEILGLAGLIGAGRTEVVRAIFGADSVDSGQVKWLGKKLQLGNVAKAISLGIGLITEDRREQSLLLEKSVKENTSLASLRQHSPGGWLNAKWEEQVADDYITIMKTKTPSKETLVKYLSGGNQQKVVIARWLLADTKLLIMDEPTRGIDVNAKAEIYSLMKTFVEEGGSILMVSSDLPEILGVSNRIMVMSEGQVSGILKREEATEEAIMRYASLQNALDYGREGV